MQTKISSGFAILDVKSGRDELNAHFSTGSKEKIPVTITGFITDVWSDDDGISREFQIDVSEITAEA
ncbi:MAG: hypothetical protein EOQ39_18700 [Mesorhizobium sp.]|uniref:hypothetical protein n=1 Tax=Mesorhizobium sp. TaxID=1871066 RepID=UPI000FE95A6D|nr:hypothetical protein [Mesorhizobium sp.]RWB08799.1 MAG: hypothetical protein EOQ37_04640 [Mesorhizobium sp.]RWB13550.1 MAG: hypothetical protein EOQ39_18700 [Mesorhizobium sp.]